MERIEGRVVGEGVVVLDAAMELDGAVTKRGSGSGTFRLALDDGREVEVSFEEPGIGPPQERRGPWAELEGDPLAAPFTEEAPGGHLKVELSGAVVRGGDRVIIEGEIERRTATDGYRGDAEVVVDNVRAHAIAVGAGAQKWLDEEAERRQREREAREKKQATQERKRAKEREGGRPGALPLTRTLLGLVLAAAGVIFGLVAWQAELGLHLTRFFALGLGLQLVITSIYKLRRSRPLPRMATFGGRAKGEGLSWAPLPGRIALGVGWGAMLFFGSGVAMEAASYAVAALFTVGLSAFALAFHLWWVGREDARKLGVIARAKPTSGDGWGLRSGTLKEGGLRRRRTHTARSSTRTESYTDSNGNVQQREVTSHWFEFRESGSGSPRLELDTSTGPLVIEAAESLWGAGELEVDPKSLVLVQHLGPGDSLVALGRMDDGVMKATGPESLFLFGTTKHKGKGNALGALRRALWLHRLGIAALVGLGVFGVVTGWINVVQDHREWEPVVDSSTLPGVSPGDRCELHIGYHPKDWESAPHRCQGNMVCGDHTVYGGWTFLGTGFFDCDMNAGTGADYDEDDGDGAIRLQPGGSGTAEIPEGEVRFHLP